LSEHPAHPIVDHARFAPGETIAGRYRIVALLGRGGILLRFGLLPLVVSAFINPILDHSPLTMDAASWYAPNSWLVLAFVTGAAVYGFRVALAGRPMLSGAFFNE
jgi:hypothetical protein